VDLLIAQGTEAGGHTGTIATMVLTPEIVDIAAWRPVLAAGGIASGRQLRSAWHEEWERPGSPAPLPMPLQPMLVNEAWQRIDAAAQAGHDGALRLESFFVGQVVGSFQQIRPAAEITGQIIADCEQRIADLARTLPGAAS